VLVPPPETLNFPPAGQELTPQERDRIDAYLKEVKDEFDQLQPLLQVLHKQKTALARALGDDDRTVAVAGAEAVEAIAKLWSKLRDKAATVPAGRKGALSEEPLLLEIVQAAVPALGKRLSTDDVRTRLACLYALERMEALAAPATADVLGVLKDKNAFVRWAAVRVLGKLPPPKQDSAVTELAKLLADDNGDVRVSTAAALERYGPAAKPSVPALRTAVKGEDTESRVWAMRALVAIGPEAKEAIPELIGALSADAVEVRRAAAESLGKFGPDAKDAVAALNKAADDADAGVRLAADQALLAILAPAKNK
jgi:HEAT repeat protein